LGYVMSFGPAQIKPKTILSAFQIDVDTVSLSSYSIKNVIASILYEDSAIRSATIILDFESREWEKYSNYNIRSDIGLLSTIYSMGGDYYRHKYNSIDLPVIYNKFGQWVLKNKLILIEIINDF